MSYNFFLEMIGCDPPLRCDPDLCRHRANDLRHNHQAENIEECLGSFCTLENPDCEHCAIDDALDEMEMKNL